MEVEEGRRRCGMVTQPISDLQPSRDIFLELTVSLEATAARFILTSTHCGRTCRRSDPHPSPAHAARSASTRILHASNVGDSNTDAFQKIKNNYLDILTPLIGGRTAPIY